MDGVSFEIRPGETFGLLGLYTTHYMKEAQRLCQRGAVMDHGKVLALDTVERTGGTPERDSQEAGLWLA